MTNTKEYGYLYNPPDAKEGDEHFELGEWVICSQYSDHDCMFPRRRLIQPGKGSEIVSKQEFDKMQTTWPLDWQQTTDGINWHVGYPADRNDILAIRRPKKQVEQSGVKYVQSTEGKVYRLYYVEKGHLQGELWNGFQWVLASCCKTMGMYIEMGCKELIPQQAADIIGVENVFGKAKSMREQLDANKQRRLEEQSQLMSKVVGEEGDECLKAYNKQVPTRNNKGVTMNPQDQDLVRAVLESKGWKLYNDSITYRPPNIYYGCNPPQILTSLDACHEVFEKDAPNGYWLLLWNKINKGCFNLANQIINLAKATPRQRCEAWLDFVNG